MKFNGESKLFKATCAVNSLHPGATRGTKLNRNLRLPLRLVLSIAQLFIKSVAQGAATQTLLAASPLVDGITGAYWSDCQVAKGNELLDDRPIASHLWTVSEGIVESAPSGAA